MYEKAPAGIPIQLYPGQYYNNFAPAEEEEEEEEEKPKTSVFFASLDFFSSLDPRRRRGDLGQKDLTFLLLFFLSPITPELNFSFSSLLCQSGFGSSLSPPLPFFFFCLDLLLSTWSEGVSETQIFEPFSEGEGLDGCSNSLPSFKGGGRRIYHSR